MKTGLSNWYRILSPRSTVLVSTINKEGVSNAAPFSFVMPVSMDPPIIAFASARKRHTLSNIRENGDFAVNIPSVNLLKELWICAKPMAEGISEIRESGLTELKSNKIRSPKIKECFARFECKLLSEYESGDHILILGEVVDTEVDKSAFEAGAFSIKKAAPLLHISGAEFTLPGEVVTAHSA